MRGGRRGLAFLLCLAGVAAWAADQPEVVDPTGAPVRWTEWLDEHGPVAVVVFASWAPGADRSAEQLPALQRACAERHLGLVVVGVQEPLEETRRALADVKLPWLHDRHGSILKTYRLIRVPVMVILERNGNVLARLDPTPAALAEWRR